MTLDFENIRQSLTKSRVAVIGDVCLDWYLFTDSSKAEVSVETGKTTRPVRVSRYSPGGAGNVAANLKSLGVGSVAIIGVAGIDPFGDALEGALNAVGIETAGLVRQREGWHTSTYTKLYEDGEEDRRIDFGAFNFILNACFPKARTAISSS